MANESSVLLLNPEDWTEWYMYWREDNKLPSDFNPPWPEKFPCVATVVDYDLAFDKKPTYNYKYGT
jgi:hypothetical protein